MPDKSTNFLYTVAVSASIDSHQFDVSSVSISTEVSSIPMITLTLGGITSSSQEVTNVDVAKILSDINTISKFQYKNVGSCTITLSPMDEEKEQVIEIKNWTVTGVGLRDLASSGSLAIEVTFMHPVCKLHTATITPVPNPDSCPDIRSRLLTGSATDASAYNMVQAFTTVFADWNKIQEATAIAKGNGTTTGDLSKLVERNKEVQAQMSTLLSVGDSAKKIPLGRSGKEAIAKLADVFVSIGGSASVWNIFLSEVLPTTGLIIKPTYDKAGLAVVPADYWGTPVRTLNLAGLSRISADPVDANPLYGVVVHGSRLVSASSGYYRGNLGGEQSKLTSVMNYVKIIPGDSKIGAVQSVTPPWFVDAEVGYAASKGMSQTYRAGSTNKDVIDNQVKAKLMTEQLNGLEPHMADAYIYENYRKGTSVTVITPVYLTDTSKSAICAGDRVNIEGSTFSFFCSKVEHVIDVAGRQAYTKWVGTRLRTGEGGYDDQLMGTKHPYYKAAN